MEGSEALNFLSALVPFALIVFIIAVGVVLLNQQFRKSIYKQQLNQEAMKSAHQQELLQTSIQAQEAERKRMARDLHDELGAALSMGRMHLVQLEKQSTVQPQQLADVRNLVEHALASTRRISHELMPLQLEQLGLEKTLESLAQQAEKATHIQTNVAIAENLGSLPWPVQLGVYRLYSELINNTLKHAEASTINISLFREADQLFGRYADDGKGLPESALYSGIGLKNLEGRITALHGSLESGNRSGGGFFARIRIPLSSKP